MLRDRSGLIIPEGTNVSPIIKSTRGPWDHFQVTAGLPGTTSNPNFNWLNNCCVWKSQCSKNTTSGLNRVDLYTEPARFASFWLHLKVTHRTRRRATRFIIVIQRRTRIIDHFNIHHPAGYYNNGKRLYTLLFLLLLFLLFYVVPYVTEGCTAHASQSNGSTSSLTDSTYRTQLHWFHEDDRVHTVIPFCM